MRKTKKVERKHNQLLERVIIDEKTKRYFKLLKKNDGLFRALLKNKASKEDRQRVAFCLTELYFISKNLVKLTEKISETNPKFTKDDLSVLLTNLIDLQIEIYDKMVDWIGNLKKPLENVINKVGVLGDDKSGTNTARKIIRGNWKQIDINLKKIKYYTTQYKVNKKTKRKRK